MQSAQHHCAPDELNFLQVGGMDLRIVSSGWEKWGLAGLWSEGGRSFLVRTGQVQLLTMSGLQGIDREHRERFRG